MVETKKLRCERCKKLAYISDIKITDRDGSKVPLCKTCIARAEFSKREQRTPAPDPSKVPFFCGRCRYKFRINPQKGPAVCPYCGKTDKVMETKEVDSEKLVQETE
jgi:protein-arginine kinase activator protein McsA